MSNWIPVVARTGEFRWAGRAVNGLPMEASGSMTVNLEGSWEMSGGRRKVVSLGVGGEERGIAVRMREVPFKVHNVR